MVQVGSAFRHRPDGGHSRHLGVDTGQGHRVIVAHSTGNHGGLVGAGTQRRIESQTGEMLSQVAKEGAKAVNGMGSSQIDGWLAERLYVALRWASLVVYLLVAESATNILHRFTEAGDAADKGISSVG